MAASALHFVALVGSLRRAAYTRAIANTLDELAPEDVQVSVLGPLDGLSFYNEDVQDVAFPVEVLELSAILKIADAVVIVTPEYNHSVPGALKNALDWLSRTPDRPLAGMPVAMQTASPGTYGGIRAQAHLREILVSLDARVLNSPEIVVPNVEAKVEAATCLLRDRETRERIASQLVALTRLSRERWLQAA